MTLKTTKERQYGGRDPMALDEAGGYYIRHVSAMTAEGLHSKADIAKELAWRDLQIDNLRAKLDRVCADVTNGDYSDLLTVCALKEQEKG